MKTFHATLCAVSLLSASLLSSAEEVLAPPLDSAPLPPTLDESAAPPQSVEPPPSSVPTGAESSDEVTIVDRTQARFEEFRRHGHLYKIKVIPRVGPAYYLIDEEGQGIWHRHDALDNNLQTPRWVIFRF